MSSGKNTIDLSLPTFDYYRIGKNVYQSEDSRIKAVVDGDTTSIFARKSLGNDWKDKSAAKCWKGENFTILCEQYGIGYSNQVVLRREHGSADSEPWDTLATGLKQFYYIDKKPRPQHVYDYRVESVFQCEGVKVNGQTVTGAVRSDGHGAWLCAAG